ncbi:hypothetical protein [Actinomadura sp. WAC 06369]|uniref:hypothetical protein n=1 Tax=Actinomadura sp. WAC 06369 TaxID=2203193 RepID=UPI000F77258C|nr:hypothetical protein [Actinomadura sp. WAC 06369]RSN67428.1 hypothetical protein DMH08_13575 [Actinomadura sp. WAC 06369]
MGEFFDVALGFPTALFSFALLVVAGYWVLVLVGGLGVDLLDGGDADGGADGADGGAGGLLAAAGLGGVPVTVALSLLIAFTWFASLAGAAASEAAALRVLLVPAAAAVGWAAARAAVLPLRRVFRDAPGTSLREFVGLPCVIRTGRVGPDFGQAEVTAPDGSTALVQVRRPAADVPVAGAAEGTALTAGSTALIFDYDADGHFFWVMPHDSLLDPPAL